MKVLRPIVLAILLAGAFFYFTTYRSGRFHPVDWVGRPHKVEITEAAGNDGLDTEEQNNISVYRKNMPTVVNITSKAVTFDFFYGPVPQEGQGSGVVIDKEGHILTNYHVIADARQVQVTLHNRKTYRAKIVGSDRSHDLAVIQIEAPNLTPAVLGDSQASPSAPTAAQAIASAATKFCLRMARIENTNPLPCRTACVAPSDAVLITSMPTSA